MFTTYVAICVFLGIISFGNGWSFWAGFVVSFFATPIVGLLFVLIRGNKINVRTGKKWFDG